MGGYGSGGRNRTHKTVEDYKKIDSFAFYHHLMGDKYLHCKNTVKYRDIVYHVPSKTAVIKNYITRFKEYRYLDLPLSRVPGIDGESVRMYFHCPYCGRRVRYLYDFHKHYVCRHCLKANYRIQQTNGMDKLRKQMENVLVKKLKYYWWREQPDLQIFELYSIPKPPYMRWEKYSQYLQEYRRLQQEYEREFWGGMLQIGYIPDDIKSKVVNHIGQI